MYLVNVVGSASHQFYSITKVVLVLDFLAIGFWPIASYWLLANTIVPPNFLVHCRLLVLHFIYHRLIKIFEYMDW